MATRTLVKLGPKAHHFWCPVTETKVLPGKTVEIQGKLSWLIKGAIDGGHLVVVTEEEASAEKPISKMNKTELTKYITPRLTEEELPKFEALSKSKMVNIVNSFAEFDVTLEELENLTEEELETQAKEALDNEDYSDFINSDTKVETLKAMLPDYFDPFSDI